MWLSRQTTMWRELIAAPAAFILTFPHRAFEESHPESPNITSIYIDYIIIFLYYTIIFISLMCNGSVQIFESVPVVVEF